MLVIDEANELMNGSVTQRKRFWGFVKNVCNVQKMTLVMVGTDELLTALDGDDQRETRFEHRFELELWRSPEIWQPWLKGYEANLPLRRMSALWDDDIAEYVQTFSDGILGEGVTLLQKGAIAAITTGEECITLDLLKGLDVKPKRLRNARRRH